MATDLTTGDGETSKDNDSIVEATYECRLPVNTYSKTCNTLKCMKDADNGGTAAKHFKEMGLSPLYCSDEVGYIPSFVDLLDGTENDCIKEFLNIQNPALLR